MTGAFERVVVPLDAASDNHTVLDTAARLAERANAPLHGIFIEDEDLVHLAALPFARQVTAGIGVQPFTRAHADLHLRAAAGRARRELEAAASRHRVKYSFEIVRGSAAGALAATTERDVVVAGAHSRPVAGHFRVERRWSAALTTAPGRFLLAREDWAAAGAVVVLLRERSAGAERLLAAAAQVAGARGGGLTVLCSAALAGDTGFDKWLVDRLADLPVPAEIEVLPEKPAALRARLMQLECRVLAIEAAAGENAGEVTIEFVQRFTCDVLTVR